MFTVAVLHCLSFHVAPMGRRPHFQPLPMCPDCVLRKDILAPGIGFHLSTSFATAAISYHDGLVENLARSVLSSCTSTAETVDGILIRPTLVMITGN